MGHLGILKKKEEKSTFVKGSQLSKFRTRNYHFLCSASKFEQQASSGFA